ncbi:MAG TPA: energy transducer TonB [Gemmatimonadaceae bacterium]|nr:energy transducer TonB [Gemmatimonadaceae bacterium]
MMQLWLTRFLKPAPAVPGLAASVVAHALLIGAAVAATTRDPNAPEQELPPNSIARFLAPPNRMAGQQAQREMIRYVAISVPEGIIADRPRVGVEPVDEPRMTGLDPVDAPALPDLAGADSVFSQIEVDSAASRYEWSAAPVFPPALLALRQEGYVRAEWVVDEQGVADTTTLRIVEATHPEFAKAVRDALPFMRFRPARIGERTVRQLVQQPFYFRVAVADTSKGRKPIS